jgi:hypothetical protein
MWKLHEYICLVKYFHKSINICWFLINIFYKNKKSKLYFEDCVVVLSNRTIYFMCMEGIIMFICVRSDAGTTLNCGVHKEDDGPVWMWIRQRMWGPTGHSIQAWDLARPTWPSHERHVCRWLGENDAANEHKIKWWKDKQFSQHSTRFGLCHTAITCEIEGNAESKNMPWNWPCVCVWT